MRIASELLDSLGLLHSTSPLLIALPSFAGP